MEPNPSYTAGSTQGDTLEGTLTSDPFVVLGDEISFLIGGGCNHFDQGDLFWSKGDLCGQKVTFCGQKVTSRGQKVTKVTFVFKR